MERPTRRAACRPTPVIWIQRWRCSGRSYLDEIRRQLASVSDHRRGPYCPPLFGVSVACRHPRRGPTILLTQRRSPSRAGAGQYTTASPTHKGLCEDVRARSRFSQGRLRSLRGPGAGIWLDQARCTLRDGHEGSTPHLRRGDSSIEPARPFRAASSRWSGGCMGTRSACVLRASSLFPSPRARRPVSTRDVDEARLAANRLHGEVTMEPIRRAPFGCTLDVVSSGGSASCAVCCPGGGVPAATSPRAEGSRAHHRAEVTSPRSRSRRRTCRSGRLLRASRRARRPSPPRTGAACPRGCSCRWRCSRGTRS